MARDRERSLLFIPACKTLAKRRARTSAPSSTAPSWPKDLGYRQHRRRGLNAHARRTTHRSDCPRAHRISESSVRTQSSACVPNADSSCRLVMRRWTHPAQTNAGRPDEREGVLDGFQTTGKAAGARCRSGGRSARHHERKKAGSSSRPTTRRLPTTRPAPADDGQDQAQYAPPPADPADEIEHLAQLHTSGALTDDEFAAAKAKILGT